MVNVTEEIIISLNIKAKAIFLWAEKKYICENKRQA